MSIKDLKLADELAIFQKFLDEEDLPESGIHGFLVHYLYNVLEWLYRSEGWYINSNMGIFQRGYSHHPVAPDIAVFKGVRLSIAEIRNLTSWRMDLPGHPPPSVVFEIASPSTLPDDVRLEDKPLRYWQMGVNEFFAYDPHTPRLWKDTTRRLRGWRFDPQNHDLAAQELQPEERGWLPTVELDGWLQEDGPYLRLLDRQGHIRLTGQEAERAAKELAWAKLRELGIDPEKL